MNIEKAIEILDDYERYGAECTHPDLPDAIKLGTEALKIIKEWRHYPFPDGVAQLPGETKD